VNPAVWTIVVAAGEGRRYGGPKQYELLDGVSVLTRSVEQARSVSEGVVAVVPPSRVDDPAAAGGADRVVAALAGEAEAVSDLRALGMTRAFADDEVARLYGLAFALEQLGANLADLSARAEELALR